MENPIEKIDVKVVNCEIFVKLSNSSKA